ncbi:MAG: hypothetical protein PHR44_06915 [Candidatus Omnitrophica bacterium]|nr:hypothetical protein [Candidatus Omnitrophota bacterium]
MLKYELGEMRDGNGAVLKYETMGKTFEYVEEITGLLTASSVYKQLQERFPSDYLIGYFRSCLRTEIYPFIRQACLIEWYKRNGRPISVNDSIVFVPEEGCSSLLKQVWEFKDAPIELLHPLRFALMFPGLTFRQVNIRCRQRIKSILESLRCIRRTPAPIGRSDNAMIACHYTEGIDAERRTDLNWYYESGISPERIMIYLDSRHATSVRFRRGKLISRDIVQEIRNKGFRWVAIERNVAEGRSVCWHPPKPESGLFIRNKSGQSNAEKWLTAQANKLLWAVHYWRCFYEEFNIKINYIPEEVCPESFAQAIAFDIIKDTNGVLVGKQRSELFQRKWISDRCPRHILFTWNQRSKGYLVSNHEIIGTLVVSGYPNNILQIARAGHYSGISRSRGANFVIALFDNVSGPDNQFSEKGMAEFYRAFLQWVIDDPAVGLIIKPKKPRAIDRLTSIAPLLGSAVKTGRCIRIADETGRFPAEASRGADMAVGIGISSALMESVIAGCRGIHYDITNLKSHEFYEWGYNAIIFNNLDLLMESLKAYKADRGLNPGLGDWSSFMDRLDPFCDGKGGQRMGVYMRWLLESFDAGEGREEAIQYANSRYAQSWGADKIANME